MAVIDEKIKDAVQKIENVSSVLHTHIGAQSMVNARLTQDVDKASEEIVRLRIDAEKKDGAIALVAADVKRLIELASSNRIGWQVWVPFGAMFLLSFASLVIQLWPKGAAQ